MPIFTTTKYKITKTPHLNNGFDIRFVRFAAYAALLVFACQSLMFGQQHTTNNKDQVLRGSGRVNASTLGMEITINLGSYPGRGNEMPVSLNYSSKVWRTKFIDSQSRVNNPGSCIGLNQLLFAEKSAAGWTTSLAVPYIEYTGIDDNYDQNGFALSPGCAPSTQGSGPPLDNAYVKRIDLHLPGGETHELRADDAVVTYPANNPSPYNFNATFFAADSSNMKYIESSAGGVYKLLLSDGSYYKFSSSKVHLDGLGSPLVRKAIEYTDANGNKTSYDSGSETVTDTIGRQFAAPVGIKAPENPTAEGNPQIYTLPGLNSSQVIYKFHWKRLNGGTSQESALTDISHPDYQLKYKADRSTINPNIPPRTGGVSLFQSGFNSWVYDTGNAVFNPVVLTEIELPTGLKYRFTYDIYGRIEQIYYPTGGQEHFDYEVMPGLSVSSPDDVSGQINFGVKQRRVYPEPNSGEPYVWNYSAAYVAPRGYKVTAISPENIKTERYLHRGNDPQPGALFGTFGYDDGLAGMAYEELVYDSTNKLVTRARTHWEKTEKTIQNAPDGILSADWHPRVKHIENFVYGDPGSAGLKSLKSFIFENENALNQIETPVLQKTVLEYGFENGGAASSAAAFGAQPAGEPQPLETPSSTNLIRSNELTYLINDQNVPQQRREIYKGRNLVGLITANELRDANGTLESRTETIYDEAGSSPETGRGNVTTVRNWDNSRGPATDPAAYDSRHRKYDVFGNTVEEIESGGNVAKTEYDTVHNAFPVKIITPAPDPDGSNGSSEEFVKSAVYDASTGLILSTKNTNGLETRIEYHQPTQRVIGTKDYMDNRLIGGSKELIYNDVPFAVSKKSRKQLDADTWVEETSHYDGLGRLKRLEQSSSGGNIFVDRQYDSDGKISRITNPYRDGETPRWTTNEYDNAGRITKVIDADGSAVITEFGVLVSDKSGTTKTVTDQAGRSRTGVLDALGRIVRVIEDPNGEALKTDYVFDAAGNIRKTVQGEQRRFFYFDSLGRVLYTRQPEQDPNPALTVTDPVTGNSTWAIRYKYDQDGNNTETIDPRNISATAVYDAQKRITKRTYSDSTPEVNFFYDGTGLSAPPQYSLGAVTKVSTSVSETRNTGFDEMGRITAHEQVTGANSYQTSYEFDFMGKLKATTYPSGRRMEYESDTDGKLTEVRGTKPGNAGSKVYVSMIESNSAGQIEKMRLGNGRWENAEYNVRNQIKSIGLGYSDTDSGQLQLSFDYGTSGANNGAIVGQSINYGGLPDAINQTYVYDNLNRIKSVSESVSSSVSWHETYQYDRYGNRVLNPSESSTLAESNKITNPEVDPSSNRILTYQDRDSVVDYGYDAAGNVLVDAENKRFTYDADNRLSSFFKGTNGSSNPDAVYQYDGEGRRVKKIESGSETVFVYNADGNLIAEYADRLPEAPKIKYLTVDHLGSTRVVTDGAGAVVSRSDYTAFGDELTAKLGNVSGRSVSDGYGAIGDLRKQYTGYERDMESGLDYAQARYYNPSHGRYTSVDPLTASSNLKDPQTFNRYSYVLNSPYKFVDPLGLISQSTGACGQFCMSSNTTGTTAFDDTADRNGPIAWRINNMYYDMARRPVSSGSSTVFLDLVVDVNGRWGTHNSETNEIVYVSDEVNEILNDATSSMASNIANAMRAINNLKEYPAGSSTISLRFGISAGVDTSISFSVSQSITYDSPEAIFRALKDANDSIQMTLVTKLKEMSTPTASNPTGIKLGEADSVAPWANMAANFGGLAREEANVAARAHFNLTFEKQKGFWSGIAYAEEFKKDY